jgi:D-hexose-6-phosphate mutarotase
MGLVRAAEVCSGSPVLDACRRLLQVELVLTDNEYTRKMWPYKFKAVYSVHLHGEDLHTDLRIINEDDKPFSFTAALHSYFEVLDIGKAKVHGLKGLTYLDKVRPAYMTALGCWFWKVI